MASYASYALEKRISKTPEEFGKGKLEGVAGPESANNAAAQTNFIPLLSLGLPITPTMALLVAALSMQNMIFGPQVIDSNPLLFWGLIASMVIGNIFLLILNLPLIRIWVYFLSIKKYILNTVVLLACITGAYYISQDWVHVLLLLPFTFLGYILKSIKVDPTPLALGFVIGPLFEEYFRRALTLQSGNWFAFFDKPISLMFMCVSLFLIISLFFKKRNI
jgi:putative tricarboxylic transport membrane protein